MKSEIAKKRAAAAGELEKRKRGTPQSGVPLRDEL